MSESFDPRRHRYPESRYFEDLTVGQTFATGTVTVDAEKLKAFAADFDPQPFHLEEVAARSSFFGGSSHFA